MKNWIVEIYLRCRCFALVQRKYDICRRMLYKLGYALPIEGATLEEVENLIQTEGFLTRQSGEKNFNADLYKTSNVCPEKLDWDSTVGWYG